MLSESEQSNLKACQVKCTFISLNVCRSYCLLAHFVKLNTKYFNLNVCTRSNKNLLVFFSILYLHFSVLLMELQPYYLMVFFF